jgi:hypothetical protein
MSRREFDNRVIQSPPVCAISFSSKFSFFVPVRKMMPNGPENSKYDHFYTLANGHISCSPGNPKCDRHIACKPNGEAGKNSRTKEAAGTRRSIYNGI